MSKTTLTSTYGGVVDLTSPAYGNPVTVANGALLQDALYGAAGTAWTVTNYGVINATSANGAVTLHAGGIVSNVGTGTISAAGGVYFQSGGAGTVINAGLITGTIGNGVTMAAGGVVTNVAGGTISGTSHGIIITGAAGTVTNAGTIAGSGTTGTAVSLAAGFANRVIVDPGAVFTGTINGGNTLGAATASTLELASAATHGVLTGLLSRYVNFAQLTVDAGAYWTFAGAGTVSAKVTLSNSGTIKGAIAAAVGATITNATGGTITSTGVAINGGFAGSGALSVTNAGFITSSSGSAWGVSINETGVVTNQFGGTISANDAVWLGATATLINAGSVAGGAEAVHVYGHLTNQSGGTITGAWAVEAAYNSPTPGTLVNAGLISGSTYGIVAFSGGAVITNQVSGTIEGKFGITMNAGHAMTVINAGTISGSSSALIFNAGGSRLVIDPGAVFVGSVNGGGSGNTLELASGVSSGMLVSLSSRYINFPQIAVDAGANWVFASTDTVASGITLTNSGSLTGPISIASGGRLVNAATGMISNAGTAIVGRTGGAMTVVNAGSISASTDAVLFAAGAANRLIIDPGAAFTGTVDGGNTIGAATASTLELASGASSGTLVSLGSRYVNFARVTVDAGAIWALDSTDTVVAGSTMTDGGTLSGGVTLGVGAVLSNASTGLITSSGNAVVGPSGGAATVMNAGGITSGTNAVRVIALHDGGLVSNASGGTISGDIGVYVYGTAGTVINAGIIQKAVGESSSQYGIKLAAGGTITNQTGGTISANVIAIQIATARGTVVNSGKISAASNNGIYLTAGGAVTNLSGGTISGYQVAVLIKGGGTVVNAGSLSSTGSNSADAGITFVAGGVVTNQAAATISGVRGIFFGTAASTLINAGVITGTGGTAVGFAASYANQVVIDPGASFSGTVNGGNTIGAASTSTLELASASTAGTLSGLGSHYVNFAQTTIDAGASWTLTGITNSLASGSSLTNLGTLTLSGATLTDNGVITNDGGIVIDPSSMTISSLIGTGTVTIAAASTLDVTGTVGAGEIIDFATTSGAFYISPGAGGSNFAGQIDGFATGNTIGLNGITDAASATIVNSNTLAITTGGEGTIDLTLNPSQSFAGATFNVATAGGNELITANDLPCFVAGTCVDTPDGPVAVEDLREGDLVSTEAGGTRPVRWIGRRTLDLMRHPAPHRARPIRIHTDAIADGIPRRDLMVSPDHALFLDGMLIAARQLLNSATIVQETPATVTYFHVELDAHDILLAEGLPAESYLDTGNRGTFENAATALDLHPDFADNLQARREANSCAPFVDDATLVEPIWRRIAHRAVVLGHMVPPATTTIDDPALHLVHDGKAITPTRVDDRRYIFVLPARVRAVRLVSRHAAPNVLYPWVEDSRQLGVMVRRITLHHGRETVTVPMDHPTLVQGWWAVEQIIDAPARWTDGNATLELSADGLATLEIELAGSLPYIVPEEQQKAA